MTREAAEYWWEKKLPSNVIHLYRNYPQEEWILYTWEERFAERKKKQDSRLWLKRRCPVILPAFIWVFYNNTNFFGGWWIYIKTLKEDYGINFRQDINEALVLKVMEMFPCGVIPIRENFIPWAKNFVQEYSHVGFKRKKNQGLLKCYVEIDESEKLVDLFPENTIENRTVNEGSEVQ